MYHCSHCTILLLFNIRAPSPAVYSNKSLQCYSTTIWRCKTNSWDLIRQSRSYQVKIVSAVSWHFETHLDDNNTII